MLLATKEQVQEARAKFYPDKTWLAAAMEVTRYTPDITELFSQRYWPLFLYGEEQPGHPRSASLIGDLPSGWTAYSFDKFSVYKHRVGQLSHPVALPEAAIKFGALGKNVALPRNIRGSVFPVPSCRFIKLDRYRQNGLMYHRIWTKVVVRYYDMGSPRAYIQRCWMYVAEPSHWNDRIDSGFYYPIMDQYRHLSEPAFNPHYAFTLNAYEEDKPIAIDEVDNTGLYEQIVRETKVSPVR